MGAGGVRAPSRYSRDPKLIGDGDKLDRDGAVVLLARHIENSSEHTLGIRPMRTSPAKVVDARTKPR